MYLPGQQEKQRVFEEIVFKETRLAPKILQAAREAGFEVAGIAPVEDTPELAYFSEWIAAGHAGEMKYLEKRDEAGRLQRASLANVAPWARSVVVCALNYNTENSYSTQVAKEAAQGRGWISRYAWGQGDYHDAVMLRLRRVEAAIHAASKAGRGEEAVTTRCYVDTGPIVERVAAKYAGVGWIGKNTCIINQKMGSWLFLGVILTSLELKAGVPAPDRCGSCTRCLEACPTDAFVGPYQLGRHIFGCDICQDVCPWNRKAPATTAREFEPQPHLFNPGLEWLAELDDEEFRSAFKGTAIKRAKRNGLRRNAAIAMGNSGDVKFVPTLDKISLDEDPIAAESARWALTKLKS